MTGIGVRELRQHASRYLDLVKAGETVEVTERGTLVALLGSPNPAVAVRDRLIASGHLVPATAEFVLPQRRRAEADTTATDVLTELRTERLE